MHVHSLHAENKSSIWSKVQSLILHGIINVNQLSDIWKWKLF